MVCVALLGTCDTKLEELLFLRNVIREANVQVALIDVGRSPTNHEAITILQKDLLNDHTEEENLIERERGDVIKIMACAKPASLIDLSSSTTSIPLCASPSLMT